MKSGAALRIREAIHGSNVSQALRHGGLLPEAEITLIREARSIEPQDFQYIISPAGQLEALQKLNLDQLNWMRYLLEPSCKLDLKKNYFLKSFLLTTARSFPIIEELLDLGPLFNQAPLDVTLHHGDIAIGRIHCLNSNIALPTGIHAESMEAVGYLQAAALKKLIKLSVRDVFSNSVAIPLVAHDGTKQKLLKKLLHKRHGSLAATDLWQLFPQWEIPDHLSDEQLHVLGVLGAEITYALMYPSVSLYPISSQERLRPPVGYDQFPCIQKIEPTLAQLLKAFLEENPGAEVAVCADFPIDIPSTEVTTAKGSPVIELTEWPQLVTSLWWRLPDAAAMAVEDCFDSCKQAFIVDQLAQLPMRVFPTIQSADAAKSALEKLVLDESIIQHADAEMVQDFLLSIAVSGAVHEEIIDAYRSRSGIFAELKYRSGFKVWMQKILGRR